ncbi:MAG TPA: 4'-phosphopantetheinyl transferase superfamily protein [Actinomycetota bacterium]|nr:4'-phosphopantetheinyl transferase superfamily protein [Actinomycetota bacterium]
MRPLRDAVHVWLASDVATGIELNAYTSLLDGSERARADRFHFFPDRRRFVVAHGLLRSILGVYGYVESAPLAISRRCALCGSEDHGKPYLALQGEPARLRFSISYCDGLVALAFSGGRELGVDVETAKPETAWREVAAHVFSSAEKAALDGRDADAARRGFYEVWTRKEAASKVSGRGLTHAAEMDSCAWTYLDDGTFEVAGAGSETRWSGRDLDLKDPHFGAVAVEGRMGELSCFWTSHEEILENLRAGGSSAPRDLAGHGLG